MDYMLTQPTGVESLVLSGPALSVPRYMADVKGLLAALPKDVQDTIARHEAAGTTDSPEYQQATQVFYKRHLSRLDPGHPDWRRPLRISEQRCTALFKGRASSR